MLATLVIGLREGLEAALIVSIVAAFLKKNGRSDALKLVWIGVATAVAICLAGGILLQRFEASLPQRQQEMLECVVAVAAVIMVSYMILWMKSHSRGLKGTLESSAGGALASGSAMALVVMAFLAVFREGFETAVFLLAAFQSSVSPTAAVLGAVLGVAIAVLLGVLLYRGAVKLDLSRFFRATGVVLVFVAAGLVMSALRAAHEAGWITVGQQPAANLTWLAEPGTVQSSLLTGVLGHSRRSDSDRGHRLAALSGADARGGAVAAAPPVVPVGRRPAADRRRRGRPGRCRRARLDRPRRPRPGFRPPVAGGERRHGQRHERGRGTQPRDVRRHPGQRDGCCDALRGHRRSGADLRHPCDGRRRAQQS